MRNKSEFDLVVQIDLNAYRLLLARSKLVETQRRQWASVVAVLFGGGSRKRRPKGARSYCTKKA